LHRLSDNEPNTLARFIHIKGHPPTPRAIWENLGVGKSGVLEHRRGNISETRKDIGKVTMKHIGRTIGSHQRSFERYHSIPTSQVPLTLDLRFATSAQNSNRYLTYGLQIWPVHSQGPSEQKLIKDFGEKGAWRIQGLPNFGE